MSNQSEKNGRRIEDLFIENDYELIGDVKKFIYDQTGISIVKNNLQKKMADKDGESGDSRDLIYQDLGISLKSNNNSIKAPRFGYDSDFICNWTQKFKTSQKTKKDLSKYYKKHHHPYNSENENFLIPKYSNNQDYCNKAYKDKLTILKNEIIYQSNEVGSRFVKSLFSYFVGRWDYYLIKINNENEQINSIDLFNFNFQGTLPHFKNKMPNKISDISDIDYNKFSILFNNDYELLFRIKRDSDGGTMDKDISKLDIKIQPLENLFLKRFE